MKLQQCRPLHLIDVNFPAYLRSGQGTTTRKLRSGHIKGSTITLKTITARVSVTLHQQVAGLCRTQSLMPQVLPCSAQVHIIWRHKIFVRWQQTFGGAKGYMWEISFLYFRRISISCFQHVLHFGIMDMQHLCYFIDGPFCPSKVQLTCRDGTPVLFLCKHIPLRLCRSISCTSCQHYAD